MSTLVLISDTKPEPKLEQVTKYRMYLSKEEREKIINELTTNNVEFDDNQHIVAYVEIEIKRYRK